MEAHTLAEIILKRIETECRERIPQPAIGRADISLHGKTKSIWLLRNYIERNWTVGHDFVGNVNNITHMQTRTYLSGDPVTYRDSKMGELVLKGLGEHQYCNPNDHSEHLVSVSSLATYIPIKEKQDVVNGELITLEKKIAFDSLKETLEKLLALKEKQGSIVTKLDTLEIEKEHATAAAQIELDKQAEHLREVLDQTIKALSDLRDEITAFFKTEVELRALAIGDEFQDEIRRSKPLNGPLVIDGGPGTGKTTSLIQRITFLVSPTIQDYVHNLSAEDLQLLEGKSNWIFFSPSELLKLYLEKAMLAENLNPNGKVFAWDTYRQQLMRQFELITASQQSPFKAAAMGSPLIAQNTDAIKWAIESLMKHIVSVQQEKTAKAAGINPSKYGWKELGIELVVNVRDTSKLNTLGQWITFYRDIEEQFGAAILKIQREYKDALEQEVAKLQVQCQQFPALLEWVQMTFYNKTVEKQEDISAEEDDEDQNADGEDTAEIRATTANAEHAFRLRFNNTLKKLYRSLCLNAIDANFNVSSRNKILLEEIGNYVPITPNAAIGEKALFLELFGFLSDGPAVNLIQTIPGNYKSWRKSKLSLSNILTNEGMAWLARELKARSNRLHPDEMDLVLLTIFSLCKEIYSKSQELFNKSSNKYLANYRATAKGVVAVDEATDASLLELLCMNALSHPRFNSLTLSGDIMQRMEDKGLRSWEDLKILLPTADIQSMKISYRQTPGLLAIAKALYKASTGKEADYRSYAQDHIHHPKPLLSVQETFDKTIQWSAERVTEIHQVFPNEINPSIAIFVPTEQDVNLVAEALNKHAIFRDNNFKARACFKGEVLGDIQQVRVFHVKYIKGLEFNSVLFLDIDRLEELYPELIDKYLYVGLSRATFHLGLTTRSKIPDILTPIENMFVDGTWR